MTFPEAKFKGDDNYRINCTGDCVTGDKIKFERAVFTGSYRNAKFPHFEEVEGEIIKESYGEVKQQHTFTIKKIDGTAMRIKGRNLYKNGIWRKSWDEESKRKVVLKEKHDRGSRARDAAEVRKARYK